MISPQLFFNFLQNENISFFTGVPDSLLKNICSYITDNTRKEDHIIAANEGNALSIGIGYHLSTGDVPLIYMQNSGLGNVINPLLSLADQDVFSIPMLLMIGWRGEPGEKDEPQHKKQGRVTIPILEAMEIPFEIISSDLKISDVENLARKMLEKARAENRPCALLIKKNTFGEYKLKLDRQYDRPLFREQAIKIIMDHLADQDIVVSTTGVVSRELFEYRKDKKNQYSIDFLTVGGMGHASQIALGIALQKKSRKVYCLDGDGALLMHMGGLAIIACSNSLNFKHIVFNNSAHDSVGGQPTVGDQVDITDIAHSCGYKWVKKASTKEDIFDSIRQLKITKGPALLEIQVKKGFRDDLGRPSVRPKLNKEEFMRFIDA